MKKLILTLIMATTLHAATIEQGERFVEPEEQIANLTVLVEALIDSGDHVTADDIIEYIEELEKK